MSVNPSAPGYGAAATATSSRQDGRRQPGTLYVDLRAARRAGRSCCCPARPAVIAVMPPAPGRPHQTDLLLCGHHYRVCRQALAASGATVVDIDGIPVTRR
jgi:uncharacterized Zn-binding protein involved in type VI secretion